MKRRARAQSRCPSCQQSQTECICSSIKAIKIDTRLVLVMHTREVSRGEASGPLALVALEGAELKTYGKRDEVLNLEHLHDQDQRVLLLLPTSEGAELNKEFLNRDSRPITLVVPDGNARQINRAAKRIPGLPEAERVHLTPKGNALSPPSTFDNIAAALGQLESPELQTRLTRLSSRVAQLRESKLSSAESIEATSSSTRAPIAQKPPSAPLSILYQDERLIAVNKPSGLLVHRGWGNDASPALQLLRDQIGQRVFPLHRLDRATSGVLMFSLDSEMAREMQLLFEQCAIEKKYLALCRGADLKDLTLHHALAKEKGGQRRPASTDFRQLGAFERYRLIEATPHTGRTHQIRRHLKHLSRPIIGDVRYGKGEHNRLFRERFNFHRLALHCASMSFSHPTTGEKLRIEAPLEENFRVLLNELELLSPSGESTL